MSWQLLQIYNHARRFNGFSLGLQPIDARVIVADIDAAAAALRIAIDQLELIGDDAYALREALKRISI